jgi:hypothetical protein
MGFLLGRKPLISGVRSTRNTRRATVRPEVAALAFGVRLAVGVATVLVLLAGSGERTDNLRTMWLRGTRYRAPLTTSVRLRVDELQNGVLVILERDTHAVRGIPILAL